MVLLKFLDGLPGSIKQNVLNQLRASWTHASTAIEGNSLTLSETMFVLSEGLTIGGKPLRDHEEVHGHARAIDMLYEMATLEDFRFGIPDLFALHKTVITELLYDTMRPIGAFKVEPNGTFVRTESGRKFRSFPAPEMIPALMEIWIQRFFQACVDKSDDINVALHQFVCLHTAFVSIHPFFDGNGRMARLLANLPVLRSGMPPLLVNVQHKQEYLQLLASHTATFDREETFLNFDSVQSACFREPDKDMLMFFAEEWKESFEIVDSARKAMENLKMSKPRKSIGMFRAMSITSP